MSKVLANWELDFPPTSNSVQVSIVICAFNKSDYTLKCLSAVCESLKFNLTNLEVILVDDCSTDNTQELFATVRGLTYLRNETNQGFLKSANRGAREAKGDFVLFLNNDTIPIGNWLDPLLQRAQANSNIGAVGVKLLNEDGSVQEAGGIIFSDGSGWNYGRGWDLSDPRINYARPVDYCSGAALMVKTEILKQLNYFDLEFAPAYYEDTDICFQVRRLGYSVWYEPNSVVMHFEGISHGKDPSSGIKAVQERNRIKFLTKWQQELIQHYPNQPELVFKAANRHFTKRVLLIDHQIPTPDQDSGSLRIFELIRSMINLNCLVTFVAQNGLFKQGYGQKLAQLGVEILPASDKNLELLKTRAGFYDYAWVCRPDPTRFYFEQLAAVFADLPVIYDTVDLHYLRLRRGEQLALSDSAQADSAQMENAELALMARSSKVVVVSDYEQQLLTPTTKTPVFLVPNVHLDIEYSPSIRARSGLVFVGGFAHQPNEDAMKWFISEIFDQITSAAPQTMLRIVGSKTPTWLTELNHPNIQVLGWVPNLAPIYAASRVCIAPLRYGAGVKGKVGEAMSYGVPMVLTNTAAEGMKLNSNQHCLLADQPAEFAQGVIELLKNDARWQEISTAGRSHISESFGRAAALNRVKQLLEL
jgi:GT2 family glycosyltransferase/glycosyltransferase involved in cell wall biosynthesis